MPISATTNGPRRPNRTTGRSEIFLRVEGRLYSPRGGPQSRPRLRRSPMFIVISEKQSELRRSWHQGSKSDARRPPELITLSIRYYKHSAPPEPKKWPNSTRQAGAWRSQVTSFPRCWPAAGCKLPCRPHQEIPVWARQPHRRKA